MNRTLPARAILLALPFLLTGRPTTAQELTLREALASALASHPAVSAAAARVDGADAAASGARAQRLPSVATSATLTRFQEPMLVAPLHAFDPTNIPNFDRGLVRGEVGAQYTLFEGGGFNDLILSIKGSLLGNRTGGLGLSLGLDLTLSKS